MRVRPRGRARPSTVSDAPDEVLSRLQAGELAPDLILLDVHMPKLDGFEFLQRLRRMPSMISTPTVFLTNSDLGRDIVVRGLSSALDYITKPDTYAKLQARLDTIIDRLAAARN